MKRLAPFVLACASLGGIGCQAAAAQPVTAPQAPTSEATPHGGAKRSGDAVELFAKTYEALGHLCTRDAEGDATCDKEDPKLSVLVIAHDVTAESDVVHVLTAFTWKTVDPCERLAARLGRLNNGDLPFRVACHKKALVLAGSTFMPEGGMSKRDVDTYTKHFRAATKQLLQTSDLLSELQ